MYHVDADNLWGVCAPCAQVCIFVSPDIIQTYGISANRIIQKRFSEYWCCFEIQGLYIYYWDDINYHFLLAVNVSK